MVNREQQEPARHHLMERIGNVTSLNDLCLKGWSDEVPMYLWSAYKIEANNTREWTLGSLPYSRFLNSRVRATSISQRRRPRLKKKKQLHQPGIEPGSVPWQGTILPLDHWCRFLVFKLYLFITSFADDSRFMKRYMYLIPSVSQWVASQHIRLQVCSVVWG